MKIVVASGKGGVGKSMLASSLAILFSKERKIVVCDCDVDAPNLGLWLGVTDWEVIKKVSTSEKAFIVNEEVCRKKLTPEVCKFGAIEIKEGKLQINPFLCEGCGACKILCKEGIEIKRVENGEIRATITKYGFPLVSAQLYPGEKGSGKIVEEVIKEASFLADFMIIDAAAGIGCPVIASIRDADYAVLVTEPTLSAISDLERIIKLINYFEIPFGIVMNKYDINFKISKKLEEKYKDKILGKIRYRKKVIEAIVNLTPVIESVEELKEEINEIYINIKNALMI